MHLKILVLIRPLKLDTEIVINSGIDVAIPATSPIAFGLKLRFSPKFLKFFTNIYFETKTISPEYIINFITSKNILSPKYN